MGSSPTSNNVEDLSQYDPDAERHVKPQIYIRITFHYHRVTRVVIFKIVQTSVKQLLFNYNGSTENYWNKVSEGHLLLEITIQPDLVIFSWASCFRNSVTASTDPTSSA